MKVNKHILKLFSTKKGKKYVNFSSLGSGTLSGPIRLDPDPQYWIIETLGTNFTSS
jgi:hypothetical protein